MFKKIIVHLDSTDDVPTHTTIKKMSLVFNIRPTDVAQKWAFLVSEILPLGVRENKRFVGFYKDIKLEIHKLRRKIILLVDKLKKLYPDTDFDISNFETGDNSAINDLHVTFVDSHLSKGNLTRDELSVLNDLNNNLHELEFLLLQEKKANPKKGYFRTLIKKLSPRPIIPASIYVTFYRKKLEQLIYEDSVIHQKFGTCYLNYSQVGRHIIDIFLSQDNNIPLDQIKIWNKFSSDFSIYLGPEGESLRLEDIGKWYNKNLLSKLKIPFCPKKLGIGYTPVADMEDLRYTKSRVKSIQKRISDYQKIHSVELI